MTATAMRFPGRQLLIHSGSGLLVMYGDTEPEVRQVEHRQGVVIRLTVPFWPAAGHPRINGP